jgi:hypothetical protein
MDDQDFSSTPSPWDLFGSIGFGFGLFTVVFAILFLSIIGLFIYAIVKQARKTAQNNAAPEVTALAAVVAKRIETSGGGESTVRQQHFVTFEQSGGERFELEVEPTQYGLLVEGDRGSVNMKGTQFLGFSRELMR